MHGSEAGDATLTLTVNRRLARALRRRDALARRRAGMRAWSTPEIHSLEGWLQRAHAASRQADTVALQPLTRYQERLLWEQVLSASELGREALQPRVAATLCQQANELLLRYEVDDAAWQGAPLPETRAFARWRRSLDEHMDRGGWSSAGALMAQVAAGIRAGRLPVPAAVVLEGFDGLNPAQRSLVGAFEARGCEVSVPAPEPSGAAPIPHLAETPRDELVLAADWARRRLGADPEVELAVLVPDLATRRSQVMDIFEDVLRPDWYSAPEEEPALFELSLGEPLERHPLARAVLAAVAALQGRIGMDEATALLLGDSVPGAAAEVAARARVHAWLRRTGEPTVTTRRLVQLCRSRAVVGSAGAAAQLAQRLDVITRGARPRGRRLPSRWASLLSERLQLLGWPGEVVADPRRFQAVQAVRDALESLAALDGILGELRIEEFGGHARRLFAERVFQYASLAAPRVQVVGALEAVGVRADALWVSGMHEGAWPPRVDPSPLLPLGVQRDAGMPGVDPALELVRAGALVRRWLASAPEIHVSHARLDGDQTLRPSPAFADAFAHVARPSERPHADPAHRMAAMPAPMESLQDGTLPALAPGSLARGGSAALRDFCACPFRSAARHRLGARDLAPPRHPLDARQRGILAHRVMQCLWQQIGGSRRLHALDVPQREAIVSGCVESSLDGLRREIPTTLTPGLRRAESARMRALCMRWLELETDRPDFEVHGAEQGQKVELGGLRFDVRIDRVDRLDGGGLLLVDYKTGRCALGDWFGESPREPQLPLYSTAFRFPGGQTELAGVTYACLREDTLGFLGVGEGEGIPAGVGAAPSRLAPEGVSMETLTATWQVNLEARARELRGGDAEVRPRSAGDCRYCELPGLCRIGEAGGPAAVARAARVPADTDGEGTE